MKERYEKPEVMANDFAQFENIYTGGCDKNPGWINNGKNPNCHWDAGFGSVGAGFSHWNGQEGGLGGS